MKASNARAAVRSLTAAALLAGAALLISGCATTTAREPHEESVAYSQLHRQMLKLAEESAQQNAVAQAEALAKRSAESGGNSNLASNQ
jgi:outer membrane biogenesis lipoprotein LolB